jgi:hypothetical protein
MEPIEDLKILISKLATTDRLVQQAEAILGKRNHSQTAPSLPPKPPRTTDHAIYQFLQRNKGRATEREELFDVFGSNEEAKRIIEDKLMTMERFGLVTIKGDLLTLRKAKR